MTPTDDELETRVVAIVQDTLRSNIDDPSLTVTATDSMETIAGWDSLQFLAVYETVNSALEIDPDFDDAIHYTSIRSMLEFLRQHVAE